jgi:hypothetical protein
LRVSKSARCFSSHRSPPGTGAPVEGPVREQCGSIRCRRSRSVNGGEPDINHNEGAAVARRPSRPWLPARGGRDRRSGRQLGLVVLRSLDTRGPPWLPALRRTASDARQNERRAICPRVGRRRPRH